MRPHVSSSLSALDRAAARDVADHRPADLDALNARGLDVRQVIGSTVTFSREPTPAQLDLAAEVLGRPISWSV